MKKLICFILALFMLFTACPISAYAAVKSKTVDGIVYQLNESRKQVSVVGYKKAELNNKAVKVKAKVSFKGKAYPVTRIEIAAGCIEGGFQGCNMKSISIPSSVKYIYSFCFDSCRKLKSITLPKRLKEAPLFIDCTSLRSIKVAKGNPYLSSRKGVLYNKKGTVLLRYPENRKAKSYVIPKSVKKLRRSSFMYARKLETVTVKAKLKQLPVEAFYGCARLKTVRLPATINIIEWAAFADCVSLCKINIPKRVKKIVGDAFNGCSSLKKVTIPKSVKTIRGYAFSNCTSLTEVYIEKGSELEKISGIFYDDVDAYIQPCGLGYTYDDKSGIATSIGTKVYIYDKELAKLFDGYNDIVKEQYGLENCLTVIYRE
jgi:hypothetical protein